jgi:steroid 5-alpha reductase family enzyme
MGTAIFYAAIGVFFYMSAVFVAAFIKKDNSIVDIAWGPGFILVSLLTFFLNKDFETRSVLATGLVIIWGARLAVHIYLRNRGRGEDFRYAKWRKDWGRWFVLRSFFQVFMLQGIFLFLISSSVVLVNASTAGGLGALDFGGAALWLVGFFFEAVGDKELQKFKQNPENKGKIMTSGLWRYTRHPNYFGEAAMWWGIWLIALSVPHGWAAVASPLAITVLLRWVSGVPMLEKKYAGNREFAEYARRTNAFFPWFPKK